MALIDFFVERDKQPAPKPKTSRQEASTPAPVDYVPSISTSSVSQFNEHFKALLKDENTRNFPGNDYYEFYLVKSNMAGLPEQQAYMIAFNGLSAAGLTKEKLIETANKYLGIVDREIAEFTQTYDQMYHENVTKLEESVKIKEKEINELSQKIMALNNEVIGIKNDIQKNSQKMTDKKNGFLMAGNSQKQEIQTEISKINQYIL